eukprot:4029642-Prymnesium_polylepis.1
MSRDDSTSGSSTKGPTRWVTCRTGTRTTSHWIQRTCSEHKLSDSKDVCEYREGSPSGPSPGSARSCALSCPSPSRRCACRTAIQTPGSLDSKGCASDSPPT